VRQVVASSVIAYPYDITDIFRVSDDTIRSEIGRKPVPVNLQETKTCKNKQEPE
jgi:hypothetical protein